MVCEKCGSRIFLVEETVKELDIEGEESLCISFPGPIGERYCLRCTNPALYKKVTEEWGYSDE